MELLKNLSRDHIFTFLLDFLDFIEEILMRVIWLGPPEMNFCLSPVTHYNYVSVRIKFLLTIEFFTFVHMVENVGFDFICQLLHEIIVMIEAVDTWTFKCLP